MAAIWNRQKKRENEVRNMLATFHKEHQEMSDTLMSAMRKDENEGIENLEKRLNNIKANQNDKE